MQISDTKLPSNRKFGFFFTLVFCIVGTYFFLKGSFFLTFSFVTLATSFLAVTMVKADILEPLNRLWFKLGLLLSAVVSPVVFTILFCVFFIPIGVVMRVLGRDELRLKIGNRKSHWKMREPNSVRINFKDQF